jgi:hypothetical protein
VEYAFLALEFGLFVFDFLFVIFGDVGVFVVDVDFRDSVNTSCLNFMLIYLLNHLVAIPF